MDNMVINRVSESLLTTIDLETYAPNGETGVFDLKDHLFMGLILKEKDYREGLKNFNWEQYRDKYTAITCSTDAIIPMWAYMLAAASLQQVARDVVFSDEKNMMSAFWLKNIAALNGQDFIDKRVVIKGCGKEIIPEIAYVEITNKLRPFVKSIMYGEPCSTVPIFKKK